MAADGRRKREDRRRRRSVTERGLSDEWKKRREGEEERIEGAILEYAENVSIR